MPKKPLNIAVDIDGVLLDFIERFIPIVHERLGVMITHESIVTHDLRLLLGISFQEVWEIINDTLATEVFPVIPGAREGLRAIGHHNISIVTSRPAEHEGRTRENLERYGFSFENIYFRKYLNKFIREDGTDVLIEDSLEEALLAAEFIPHVLLFRQPWNCYTRNCKGRLIPVADWDEIVQVIGTIEGKA